VSTTSGLVTKLADRGLIDRRSSEADRRQIPLELSEAGLHLAGELAAETTQPFLEGVAEELGDDLDDVAAVLETLALVTARVRAR
jgi:DNA-binding MarR family transcriptional regulator